MCPKKWSVFVTLFSNTRGTEVISIFCGCNSCGLVFEIGSSLTHIEMVCGGCGTGCYVRMHDRTTNAHHSQPDPYVVTFPLSDSPEVVSDLALDYAKRFAFYEFLSSTITVPQNPSAGVWFSSLELPRICCQFCREAGKMIVGDYSWKKEWPCPRCAQPHVRPLCVTHGIG